MRKASRTLAAAFMAAIVLAGCQNEDPMNKVKEGLPVSLSFNMEAVSYTHLRAHETPD